MGAGQKMPQKLKKSVKNQKTSFFSKKYIKTACLVKNSKNLKNVINKLEAERRSKFLMKKFCKLKIAVKHEPIRKGISKN